MEFRRYYNTGLSQQLTLGSNWLHNYGANIIWQAPATVAYAVRADGMSLRFALSGGVWIPESDVAARLEQRLDGSTVIGWKYTTPEDQVELYDIGGKLISIANRAGLIQTLTYETINSVTRLKAITGPFGRTLTFSYDPLNRIATMIDPDNRVYSYAYSAAGNLASVTYPDLKTKTYVYNSTNVNEQQNTSNTDLCGVAPKLCSLLTGITDENGVRFATYKYDTQARAISSEHANGAEKVTLTYNADGTTIVTDALGAVRKYSFATLLGVVKNTSIDQPCTTCGGANSATTYDANGFVASLTDFNGNVTTFIRNDPQGRRDLETSRTEASGTPLARTITTAYHPTFRLPTLIMEPGRTTAMTYDSSGNMLTKTITDTASGKTRAWTYTYNANGQVLTMNGPRTDVPDVTTYTYFANNDPNLGKRGNIATITNALGHVTNITAYNAHGQPLTIVDPNGLPTTLTYDARQRLTSRNVGGETTTYTYDGVGQLTRVTMPDGSFLNYTYDAAHRLTQISDNLNNKIVYTLDAMGNRTKEDVFDPANALAQTRSRVYSNLNRLSQEIGAAGQTTAFAYDNQGNLTSIDGPLAGTVDVTTNTYDALNRLTRMTDPKAGQVNYGYNALDQMTSVRDPRNLMTSYAYDALDNLNTLTSPDTGPTKNTYDAAGNLLTQVDAKGQTTTYTYDALNRVKSIAYATDASLNVTFTYDQGPNGKGRLTGVADNSGTMSYVYDLKGRLTSETRAIGGVTYVTGYAYDSAGRLASMTYPGGREITYTRDGLGRVSGISTTKGKAAQTLLSAVTYRPFGPERSFTFGNKQTYTRGFDQDGRIASYTMPGQTLAVGYDTASRISSISDIAKPTSTLNFGYDTLDRITSFIAPSLSQSFSYDATGNRTSQTIGANSYTSTYSATSNRIATTSGPIAKSYTHDTNGSITNDTRNQLTYDARGRLKQATSVAGVSQYLVNTLGQRVKKTSAGIDTVFHYDSGGRLISETDAKGNVRVEYIYLNDVPIAVLK